MHIQSIAITPDPPQRGQDLTIVVEGVADDDVTVGAIVSLS